MIIKIDILSNELSRMSGKKFKKVENLRDPIIREIAKIVDIDRRLIELLLPYQTKNGLYLTFHIRTDSAHASEMMSLIRIEAKNGNLARSFFNVWSVKSIGITTIPQIGDMETKEIKPELNWDGESNDVAAVISLKKKSTKNLFSNQTTSDGVTTGGDTIGRTSLGTSIASQNASFEMEDAQEASRASRSSRTGSQASQQQLQAQHSYPQQPGKGVLVPNDSTGNYVFQKNGSLQMKSNSDGGNVSAAKEDALPAEFYATNASGSGGGVAVGFVNSVSPGDIELIGNVIDNEDVVNISAGNAAVSFEQQRSVSSQLEGMYEGFDPANQQRM